MSYTIDIYRGRAKPTNSLWHFSAYVSMFPQLVAGPIVRYTEMERQLRDIHPPSSGLVAQGIYFFVFGLGKKLLIADLVAARVNGYFLPDADLDFVTSWLATLGYTVQIYFDFSGYSDMAVGLGLLLGFRLPQNFNSPYKASDISDFWRRWHMTLSFWLRDYLYISLGGNRHGKLKTLRNLFLTMFLGGLWHGAAWTFVFWGVLHGAYLVIHQLWQKTGIRLPRLVGVAVTFLAVVVGWVFFRAETFSSAFSILDSMTQIHKARLPASREVVTLFFVLVGLGIAWLLPNSWEIEFRPTPRRAVLLALVFVVCVSRLSEGSPFLYFQF